MYPPIEPYDHGLLDVGDGQRVYWETCGNPAGKPALVLHGGPGQGCTPGMRRTFDPARYRVVLVDQRGCGRSLPHASDPATSLRHNTTEHLVADLERLREHLGVERWLLTGGSWGTTLALVYAERFPHRVSEIVLSAISTTRRSEIDWLYRGAGRFFPEAWQRFRDGVGDDDVVRGYARLMADPGERERAALAWIDWEETVLSLEPGAEVHSGPLDAAALAFVRLTTHYYANAGWLEEGAVIRDAGKLAGIPGVLIHGRLDLSCPVTTAWELARAWPGAELLVDDRSGHRASDTKRAWKLAALDRFAR
ncbi:proline iminopeptidase [Amycolatopsis lexingtonensis]|uniref:Proline iminopeptidase n=1 Tax=Amycolatopsis lexingtonensis TaxID=218822 RepID=A0ABR9HRY6_9PSEU|nr:prolyl aminopeptidase [Amycolatopsis lexingtonensis]MBE1493685.1 proline iminopeptidase [Amycolatopsis lexingtonensis]